MKLAAAPSKVNPVQTDSGNLPLSSSQAFAAAASSKTGSCHTLHSRSHSHRHHPVWGSLPELFHLRKLLSTKPNTHTTPMLHNNTPYTQIHFHSPASSRRRNQKYHHLATTCLFPQASCVRTLDAGTPPHSPGSRPTPTLSCFSCGRWQTPHGMSCPWPTYCLYCGW